MYVCVCGVCVCACVYVHVRACVCMCVCVKGQHTEVLETVLQQKTKNCEKYTLSASCANKVAMFQSHLTYVGPGLTSLHHDYMHIYMYVY